MPQQVLASPKAPEFEPEQRSHRERELRVQADAGVFGMLLGALQAGEAGIVRGEARNDSAAEWNARNARQERQSQREPAQSSAPRAQEPREPLARLTSATNAQNATTSPAERAQVERVAAEPGSRSNSASQNSRPGEASTEAPAPQARATHGSDVAATRTRPNAAQPVAAPATTSAPGTGTTSNGSSSQVSAVASTRGPQGGAARGPGPASQTASADRNLRFERAFQSQLGRGLAKALQSGDGTVTLRLKPAHLGRLQVRVHVEHHQVRASFEAQTVEAQRMLEASKDSLRHQLEARGLSVERIDVRLVEEPAEAGTRFAKPEGGGAGEGQEGRTLAHDRGDHESSDRGDAEDGARGGAPRRDDEPSVVAEPRRELGTVRLDAIA